MKYHGSDAVKEKANRADASRASNLKSIARSGAFCVSKSTAMTISATPNASPRYSRTVDLVSKEAEDAELEAHAFGQDRARQRRPYEYMAAPSFRSDQAKVNLISAIPILLATWIALSVRQLCRRSGHVASSMWFRGLASSFQDSTQ